MRNPTEEGALAIRPAAPRKARTAAAVSPRASTAPTAPAAPQRPGDTAPAKQRIVPARRAAAAGAEPLIATHRSLLLDYLRVPYTVEAPSRRAAALRHASIGAASVDGRRSTRRLTWPLPAALEAEPLMGCHLGEIPFHARVLPNADSPPGPGSRQEAEITDWHGNPVAAIWRDRSGGLHLPFDPGEALTNFWSERYWRVHNGEPGPEGSRSLRAYYRVRPLVPRPVQIALRRAYSHRQRLVTFPAWPYEPALHDLIRAIYGLVADAVGFAPPWIAPWPRGYDWALVLTHDVETAAGVGAIGLVREVEEALGYRSAWNFVPERYPLHPTDLGLLRRAGLEVGVHGLHHDGRDLESRETLHARLPAIRRHADAWSATGFRSPATQRRWELMDLLGFDYDSSYPDTDLFEPQPGGCCSWLPFENGATVELPITLPQDHTLFVILRERDETTWVEKAGRLRDRGGMALMLSHPDYLRDAPLLDHYRRFLEAFASDTTAWRALPGEVSAWWRRRAASEIVRGPRGWRIRGPAAEDGVLATTPPG